jgi:hypothetical protein
MKHQVLEVLLPFISFYMDLIEKNVIKQIVIDVRSLI